MRTRAFFAAAMLAGLAGSSSSTLQAADRQCYRTIWEAPGTCSSCQDTCLGGNYLCCRIIVVGDN